MKALALLLAILIALLPCAAQNNTKPSMFTSESECKASLASGNFAYYAPVDLSKKAENPIDNSTIFGVKLETDTCRHQWTMKGWQYIVQVGGSMMRARKDAAGNLTIFARNDCGNADNTDQIHPALPPTLPEAPAQQADTVQPACPASGCTYSSSTSTVNINFAEVASQPWQPSYVAPKQHHYGLLIGAVVVGAVVVGIVFGLHHGGGNTTAGYAGTGGAQ